jgi:hypothetical protein
MSHTKEPWSVKRYSPAGLTDIYVDHGTCQIEHIADVVVNENARRIVSCVNACAGLDAGLLENIAMTGGIVERFALLNQTEQQRDELLAVLQSMFNEHGEFEYDLGTLIKARAAIANAKETP